jgi:nicotinamidase-related amidase
MNASPNTAPSATPLNFQDLPHSFAELVAPARTALVLWDLQKGLAGKAPNLAALKTNAAALIAAADAAGVLVVWSEHTFPPLDQLSGHWLRWMMKRQNVTRPEDLKPMFQAGSEEVQWLEGFKPQPHHLVLKKQQPSLFFNTPFDHHLSIKGIRTIVLAGFATDIGIDFTARHGNALGYHAVIAEDACGAYVQANHERSIAFLRDWAEVASTAQVVSEWCGL